MERGSKGTEALRKRVERLERVVSWIAEALIKDKAERGSLLSIRMEAVLKALAARAGESKG